MNKKLKLLLILILVFLSAYFVSSNRREVFNLHTTNVGVVAFGDSLVEGIGSSQGGGFVKILSEKFQVPIMNLGKRGETTAMSLSRVEEVTRWKPAVTVLLVGGNDFLQGVPEETTAENLGQIIEAIHQSGSAVILVGLEADTPENEHQEIFDKLSTQHKTAYVPDVLRGIYGYPKFMSQDGLHPNDLGYDLMAKRIGSVLADMIEQ